MSEIESDKFRVAILSGSSNYRTWKFSMKMLLMAKDLWGVVSGDEGRPSTGSTKEWEARSQKALANISLSVSAAEQQHIIDCTSAKEAWDILEKLYEGKGRNRKFMLLEELFKLSMMDDDSVAKMEDYLRSVKSKFSELAAIGVTLDKDIKLGIVFNGINEKYRYLVVMLEQQEEIDFDELSAHLIEEAQRYVPNDTISAFKAGSNKSGRSPSKMKCYYCGQMGHVKAECPVREYRIEKYGDKVDIDGSAKKATSGRIAF